MNKKIIIIGFVFILLSGFISATDFTQNNVFWVGVNQTSNAIEDFAGNVITNNGVSIINTNEMSYDGLTDFINIDSVITEIQSDTIGTSCVWLKSDVSGVKQQFISVTNSGNTQRVDFNIESNNVITFGLNDGGNKWFVDTNFSQDIINDALICVVQNGIEPVIYVNGTIPDYEFFIEVDKTKWYNDLTINKVNIGKRNFNSITDGFFDGVMYSASMFDVAYTSTQILELFNNGKDFNPYILPVNLFEITSSNIFNLSTINKFNVTISNVNGTSIFIPTINGSIFYPKNETINVSIISEDYISRLIIDWNTSIDLEIDLWQSELIVNAKQLFTNSTILNFNVTVLNNSISKSNISNSTGNTTFFLNGDISYFINGAAEDHGFNSTTFVNISIGERKTITLDFISREVNISARDLITNVSINNFIIEVRNDDLGVLYNVTTTTGLVRAFGVNGTYDVTIFSDTYANQMTKIDFDKVSKNFTFFLAQTESVYINIFDQSTGDLITQNVSIQFVNELTGFTNFTITGGFFIANLTPTSYTIWFDLINYTKTPYFVTVTAGSNLTLNAYLPPITFTDTVTMEFVDKNDGSKLEDVSVAITRIVGTTQTQINVLTTDVTGLIEFNFEENVEYCFVGSLSGYEDKSFCLSPILRTEYTVNMDRDADVLNTVDLYNINLLFNPTILVENNNDFTIQFISPDGDLISYLWSVEYKGTTINSGSGSNSNGQLFTDIININNPSVADIALLKYSYVTAAAGEKNYTYIFEIIINPTINNTFMSIKTDNKTYGLSIFERALIVAILAILLSGMAFFVGGFSTSGMVILFTYSFFVFIEFISIWVGIVPMFITFIFWVWGAS